MLEPPVERSRFVRREPPEAEGPQLTGHRIGPDGQWPVMDGRLDGRVPESLPGRRQGHGVARRVGVAHLHGRAATAVTVTATITTVTATITGAVADRGP